MARSAEARIAQTAFAEIICTRLPRDAEPSVGLPLFRGCRLILDFPAGVVYLQPTTPRPDVRGSFNSHKGLMGRIVPTPVKAEKRLECARLRLRSATRSSASAPFSPAVH